MGVDVTQAPEGMMERSEYRREWRKARRDKLQGIIADIGRFNKAGGIATPAQVKKLARTMLDRECARIRKQAKPQPLAPPLDPPGTTMEESGWAHGPFGGKNA